MLGLTERENRARNEGIAEPGHLGPFSYCASGSIAIPMSMVDSRPVASTPERERRSIRPLFYASVILAVFVVSVITMALKDGASGAVVTTLLSFAITGTAVGVWGTAMAVRETENFGSPTED